VSTTVLPALTAESAELAERLVRLSGEESLDLGEAKYILGCGVAALERVPGLWPITRGRLAAGMTSSRARLLIAPLLDAVHKNLTLAGILKKLAQVVSEQAGHEPEIRPALEAAETHLLEVRAELAGLLAAIDAPGRWPDEQQLGPAKTTQSDDWLTAEEFRRELLGE
jgi:hypothetical protein